MSYVSVDRATWESHLATFPEPQLPDRFNIIVYRRALDDLVKMATDWEHFRFYEGAVNTGYREDKYAISKILKMKRPITIGEHYNVFNGSD